MSDAPDLRTAAQALADGLDEHGDFYVVERAAAILGPQIRALRAALAVEATEPPPSPERWGGAITDADVIWTCPPCRRGEHVDCMDAETGTCQCAGNDHASGPAPVPQGARQMVAQIAAEHAATWQPASTGFVPDGVSLARPGGGGAPDEPGDDDLTELRRLAADANDQRSPSAPAARAVLAEKVPGLLAEVERHRADDDTLCGCGDRLSERQGAKCGNCQAAADAVVTSEIDRLRKELTAARAEVERLRAAAPASEEVRSILVMLAKSRPVTGWQDSDPDLNGRWWCVVCKQIAPAGADRHDDAWHTTDCAWARTRRLPAGSPPPTPAPTRERLIEVLTEVYREYDGRAVSVFEAMADAVLALLSEPAPPLWTGPASLLRHILHERGANAIGVPPGTAVEVRRVEQPGGG